MKVMLPGLNGMGYFATGVGADAALAASIAANNTSNRLYAFLEYEKTVSLDGGSYKYH